MVVNLKPAKLMGVTPRMLLAAKSGGGWKTATGPYHCRRFGYGRDPKVS